MQSELKWQYCRKDIVWRTSGTSIHSMYKFGHEFVANCGEMGPTLRNETSRECLRAHRTGQGRKKNSLNRACILQTWSAVAFQDTTCGPRRDQGRVQYKESKRKATSLGLCKVSPLVDLSTLLLLSSHCMRAIACKGCMFVRAFC